MILNLCKAAVALVASPLAAVADVLTLPSTAYNDRPPFARTADTLRTAGQAFKAATKPEAK